jgi:type IV pilus assembly protein PilM
MDVDGLALLNCMSECEDSDEGRATVILNVGSTYSNLVIAGEGVVPFVRDTSHAGSSIINQIAEQTQLSTDRITEIIFSQSGNEPSEESATGGLISASFEDACQSLIEDVTGTLRYYSAQKKSHFIEKILVCGGFARAAGFVEILDRRLPASAVLWNPFEKMNCSTVNGIEEMLKEHGPSMAVAAGLAMRSI